jgi:hypothetical protein
MRGRQPLLPPCLPGILEVANQLLLLGVDTDDGPVGAFKALLLPLNMLKLLLPPHSWDHLPFRDRPVSARSALALHLFFLLAVDPRQRTCQFLPPTLNRPFVQASDLREQPISTKTNSVGLNRDIPARLLFIQATRAADSSVDEVLDPDAVFPAGNGYTGRYEPLIVALLLPQTPFLVRAYSTACLLVWLALAEQRKLFLNDSLASRWS